MLNFNKVAAIYDSLALLVYGKTLEKGKRSQLLSIKSGQSVLFIGGGTGATLEYLNEHYSELNIDYVEVSTKMMQRAKLRSVSNLSIRFYNKLIEEFAGNNYDVIITEFFFDLFEKKEMDQLVKIIADKLGKDGIWIDTDFRISNRISHKIIMKATYWFFRLTINLKAKRLLEPMEAFRNKQLYVKDEKIFGNGLVTSRLFVQN